MVRSFGGCWSRALPLALSALLFTGLSAPSAQAADDSKEPSKTYRVIVFGAHPDDCELMAGGTAARWAKLGFEIKFVSVTNGDIGHHEMAGGPLAQRRTAEVRKSDKILGVKETEVLDNHDGELLPTLENRKTITKLIRQWNADIVISPRPNDYHPDHRYTAVLVQDSAFMVTVPHFCPDVPALKDNPVFFYCQDRFLKPNPFVPDVVVSIDSVFDQKVDAIDALPSQFYEWNPWLGGYADEVPKDAAGRREWLKKGLTARYGGSADRFRDKLVELLGPERGKAVQCAEAFEVCEYGRRPSKEELMKIFPFFGEADGK